LAKSAEGFEDLVGGLGPDERAGVLVPDLDPGADVGFKGRYVLVNAALEQFGGQFAEPAFNLVERAITRRIP